MILSIKKDNSRYKIFLYILSAILIFAAWSLFTNGSGDLVRIKSTGLLCVYLFYIFTWIKTTKTAKSLFFFYLCYTAFTNAGQLFLLVFGIDVLDYVNVMDFANDTLMCKAIEYQMQCTVLMATFALIAHEIHSISQSDKEIFLQKGYAVEENRLTLNDVVLIVTGAIYFLGNLIRLSTRTDMTYLDAFQSGEAETVPFIIVFAYYISLYGAFFAHRAKGDRFKGVILLIASLVGITNLLFGSRNVLIPLLFGLIFVWKLDYKKMPLRKKIGVVAVALFGMYLLSGFVNFRHIALSQITLETLVDSFFGKGLYYQLITFVSEMGGSLKVLTTTISAIDIGSITGEQTFLYTVLKGIVPQVEILDALGIHEPTRWHLSTWITDTYGQNAGWGFSMYAEAYYNFEAWGCVFMGAFGYIYSMLECKIEKWYTKGYTVVASAWLFLASYLIFLARADSFLITTRLRYIIYLSILCVFLRGRVSVPKIRFKWQDDDIFKNNKSQEKGDVKQ